MYVSLGARAGCADFTLKWGIYYGPVRPLMVPGHAQRGRCPAELKKRAEAHMSKMAETHRTRTA